MIKWIERAFWLSFYILILWGCTSCATQKNAEKYLKKHPEWIANTCDSLFPIQSQIIVEYATDSSLLEQYEKEFADMWFVIDSLVSDTDKVRIIREAVGNLPTPKTKVVTITKESTAKLDAQKYKYEGLILTLNGTIERQAKTLKEQAELSEKRITSLGEDLQEEKERADKIRGQRNRYFWLLLISLAYIFRKPLTRLFVKILSPIKF